MRRPAILLVPLLLTAPLVGVAEAQVPPALGCRGEKATLVGDPDRPNRWVRGTPGRDVIVSNGSSVVVGNGGDDLICVTGRAGRTYTVDSGPGDDEIHVVARRISTDLIPGTGSDVVVGGRGHDEVSLAGEGSDSGDVDRIRTRGGADYVGVVGVSPGPFPVTHVDLGPGADVYSSPDGATYSTSSTIEGGPGADELAVDLYEESRHVRLDLGARTLDVDGDRFLAGWTGFEEHGLLALGDQRVDVIGSDGPDRVFLVGGRRLEAALGGGDDVLFVDGLTGRSGAVDGGPGRDRIRTDHDGPALPVIDLGRGRSTDRRPGARPVVTLGGIEDVTLATSRPALVVGDGGANRLSVSCGTVRGGAGADQVRHVTSGRRCSEPTGFRAFGQAGNDVLVGSRRDDVLIGGPGRDTARGLAGRDRCVAEVRTSCER